MKNLKQITAFFCAVVLVGFLSANVKADESDKRTVVTFSEPIEIPGMVLPAGTYVFKIIDMASDRNIVQIFNKDEDQVYATILAVPSYRLDPTGKTKITFWERAENAPPALRTWFYPGDLYGEEFVYHRPKALQIAQRADQPVVAMPTTTAPTAIALKTAPLVAVKSNSQEVQVAEVTKKPSPPPSSSNTETQMASAAPVKHLPKTASDLPLAVLVGVLSLSTVIMLEAIYRILHSRRII